MTRVVRGLTQGFTLIELVVAIVIIGIGVTTAVGALTASAARSVDIMLQYQAQSIASAYLNEALSLPYNDPVLPNGEALRAQFDDVLDYNNFVDNVVRDRSNTPVAGLAQYQVTIRVVTVDIDPAVPIVVPARRVTVSVRTPTGDGVDVVGFRTNHP